MNIDYPIFLKFVTERHAGQVSQSGEPYVLHLISVADRTRQAIASFPEGLLSANDADEALLVALGHDLFEDERATPDDIRMLGGSESLIARINALSRLEPKPVYQTWIEGIAASGDLVSIIVKKSDNEDNNSDERIASLPSEKQSIRRRYSRAHPPLQEALDKAISDFLSRPAILPQ